MKILFISLSTVPFGSNDLLFYRAAEQFLVGGHEVMVSPWDWREQNAPEYDQLRDRGATLYFRQRPTRPDRFLSRQIAKARHRLTDPSAHWRFAAAFRPDAIVISDPATYHFLSTPGLVSFLERAGVPYFLISQFNFENASLPEDVRHTARRTFANARTVFFVSERNLLVAKRQLCQHLHNAVVVHNPPNLSDWTPIPYPITDPHHYCMVARLECAVKGQALILQLFAEPQWRKRDWRLSLFGQGPDEAYLRDLVSFLDLNTRVTLQGHSNDLRALWAEHHLLIMASSGEGKPLALTEAMLCARPAVVTDVAGNAELIEDGVSGFVAHSATIAGLRAAMEESWSSRHRWRDMGLKAHEFMAKALVPPPGHVISNAILKSVKSPNSLLIAFP